LSDLSEGNKLRINCHRRLNDRLNNAITVFKIAIYRILAQCLGV